MCNGSPHTQALLLWLRGPGEPQTVKLRSGVARGGRPEASWGERGRGPQAEGGERGALSLSHSRRQ